jgi:hypothetical protein
MEKPTATPTREAERKTIRLLRQLRARARTKRLLREQD